MKRPDEKSAPQYLAWLRLRPCAVEGCDRPGKIEAAHVPGAGDKGIGSKTADRNALPLCGCAQGIEGHHAEQHRIGWATFAIRYGLGDPLKLAGEYFSAWPGKIAWLRKLAEGQ